MGSNDNVDQSWKRPWTLNEVVTESNNWSLAADAGVCELLKKLSSNLLKDFNEINTRLSTYSVESKKTNVMIQNTFNDLCMLANDQFMENLVEDVSSNLLNDAIHNENKQPMLKEEKLLIADKEVSESLQYGMEVLNSQFEVVEVIRSNSVMKQNEEIDDEFLEGEEQETLSRKSTIGDISQINEPIYQPKDPYENRHLPHLVGTDAFISDETLGIGYIDEDKSVEDEEDSDEEDENENLQENNLDSLSEEDDDKDSLESHRLQSETTIKSSITKKENKPVTLSDDNSDDDMFLSSPKEDLDDLFDDAPKASKQSNEINEDLSSQSTQSNKQRQSTSSGDVFQDALMNQLVQKLSKPNETIKNNTVDDRNNEMPTSVDNDLKVTTKSLDFKKEKITADSFGDIFDDDDLFAETTPSNIPSISVNKKKDINQTTQIPNISDSIKSEQNSKPIQQPQKKANEDKKKVSALTWSDSDSDDFENMLTSITKKPTQSTKVNAKLSNKATNSPRPSHVTQKPSLLSIDSDDDDGFIDKLTKKPSFTASKVTKTSISTAKIPLDNDSDNDLFEKTENIKTDTNENNNNQSVITDAQKATPKTPIIKKSIDNDSSIKSPQIAIKKPNSNIPKSTHKLSFGDDDDDEKDLFDDLPSKKTVEIKSKIAKPTATKSQPKPATNPLIEDSDSENDLFKGYSKLKKPENKSKPKQTLFSTDEDDEIGLPSKNPKPTMEQNEKLKETQVKLQEPSQPTIGTKRNFLETIEKKIENDAAKKKLSFGDATDGDDDDMFIEAMKTSKQQKPESIEKPSVESVETISSNGPFTEKFKSMFDSEVEVTDTEKHMKQEKPIITTKKHIPGTVPIFQPNLMGELMSHSRYSKPKAEISDDDNSDHKEDRKDCNDNNSGISNFHSNPLIESPIIVTSKSIESHFSPKPSPSLQNNLINTNSVMPTSQTMGQSSLEANDVIDIDAPVIPVQRLSLLTKGRPNPRRRPTKNRSNSSNVNASASTEQSGNPDLDVIYPKKTEYDVKNISGPSNAENPVKDENLTSTLPDMFNSAENNLPPTTVILNPDNTNNGSTKTIDEPKNDDMDDLFANISAPIHKNKSEIKDSQQNPPTTKIHEATNNPNDDMDDLFANFSKTPAVHKDTKTTENIKSEPADKSEPTPEKANDDMDDIFANLPAPTQRKNKINAKTKKKSVKPSDESAASSSTASKPVKKKMKPVDIDDIDDIFAIPAATSKSTGANKKKQTKKTDQQQTKTNLIKNDPLGAL